jgi:YbbR domain-containing protein
MKSGVSRLPGMLVENAGWKLLSLAVAVLLWAIVASEPEMATIVSVRVLYENLPEELEISSEPVNTVSLELRGPAAALRGIGEGGAQAEVILDMAGVRPGQRTFVIGDDNLKLPRGVRLTRSVPSEVRFTFEHRRARFVPVRPRFTGQGQNGYTVGNWSVEPHEMEIVGPAGHVARVDSVVTDPVDVSTVTSASEFRVNAYLDDPYVRFRSSPQVKVKVTMKKE